MSRVAYHIVAGIDHEPGVEEPVATIKPQGDGTFVLSIEPIIFYSEEAARAALERLFADDVVDDTFDEETGQ